ncbi:hypothetical protein WA026_019019 [Henosepilachna vigintioctopunctata]|uniref:Beclin-1-like protein n=1 Tax=Henosepilachna vigintioctopunctata TaxID=420089 RepID=A0AAW1VHE7_9CUCU
MAEDKVYISFTCQRCSQPLILDETLNYLSEHVLAELNLPIHSNPEVDLESQANSFDNYIHPCRLSDSGNGVNGFMMISDENESELLSHKYKVHTALFDTISGNSNIDHPLCDECTDYMIELLDQQLQIAQNDYDDYQKYYNKLLNETNEPKLSDLEKELQELTAEESRYLEELEVLQKEEIEMKKAITFQEDIAKLLSQDETKYHKEHTKYRVDLMHIEEEARSLHCQIYHIDKHLEKLKKTNVFNATFHIWHKGHFGTINNFCLGRLPSAPVAWSEINAAWGQTALLLSALARKINLTFERYRLVPFGNHSRIEVIGEQKELPLYGSGGVRFLWDTKFDSAMAAFLDCLQQFQEKVEKGSKTFCFPYKTCKGKIEDKDMSYSIKIQLNSEEQWTKALKFMLTNLKWGLAFVSSQFNSDGEEIVNIDH